MQKDTTITLSGKDYVIPRMPFARLEKVWPLIDEMQALPAVYDKSVSASEMIARQTAKLNVICKIFSAAMSKSHPEMTVDEIKERLMNEDQVPLMTKVSELLTNAGLISGEASPSDLPEKALANGSTGTLIPSSLN